MGSNLQCIGTGDHFLHIILVAQTLRSTIKKWYLLKLRSLRKSKDIVNKTKRQPIKWEKIFTNPTSDRAVISKIYKEFKKLDIKVSNDPIKKLSIDLNREFSTEESQMAERHIRKS